MCKKKLSHVIDILKKIEATVFTIVSSLIHVYMNCLCPNTRLNDVLQTHLVTAYFNGCH